MIKSKLLLQLLMRLLTNPPCLDGGGQRAQIRRCRKIGEIVFLLPGGTLLANEPGFVAGEMLLTFIPYPLRRAVGGADTESSKSGFERPFVPLRQLTAFHLALASNCSAAIDKISGTWCFRGLPRTWRSAK
ncbi:hypothetical protein XI08_09995 [Bradyrhizobium sp. CCBAU 11361]|nr:hypothetical protein [Bradyrhizobium sp. CCBAU 11361]